MGAAHINALGGQEDAGAWMKFTIIFGAISAVLFILSAMSVKDVDVYNPDMKVKEKGKQSFLRLFP